MVNTGISIDDDVLDDFDRAIALKKANGEIPTNMKRSHVIQMLMEDFIEDTLPEGNLKRAAAAPTAD